MIAATQSNHPLGNIAQTADGTSPLEIACAKLRNSGMRVTRPRVAILGALVNRAAPASIEQIHQELDKESCDLVTVYRCLAAFESLGLVRRSYLRNGTSLYELTIGQPRHYHIVCNVCGRAERVDYFSVEGMERMLRDRGYTDLSHLVEFFGVCPTCQTENTATRRVNSTMPATLGEIAN